MLETSSLFCMIINFIYLGQLKDIREELISAITRFGEVGSDHQNYTDIKVFTKEINYVRPFFASVKCLKLDIT